MARGVDIERRRSEPMVECEQRCLHPDSTRERARQHARDSGHTVRVMIEDTTVYRRSETETK